MAGIEEAFEKFSDRLAREETKRYSRDEQGDYREYLSEEQDQYPIKLGPLQLGANANMSTGKYSPNQYQNVSTMNRNVGLRGRYDVPDSGIALLGSIGDVRSNQNVRTNLPFNPMTGEASPYSEMRKDVYKDSPYSIGAQYIPQGTNEMYSALYNKGGGYNLGYNKGPVNVSYTSNPGLSNNVMLRGQYSFADGGRAGYADGAGPIPLGLVDYKGTPWENSFKLISQPQSVERKMGLFTNPDGSYPDGNIPNPIQALPRPGMPTTQTETNVNPIERSLEMAGFTKEEIMRIMGERGFSNGGRVSMSEGGLTKTVPPAKGPDSQGVESLFRRRYS